MTYTIATAAIRSAIVAALDLEVTVDGVLVQLTGHPTRPDSVNAYDGWPEWRAAVPVTGAISETTWYVLVALPGADLHTAVAVADQVLTAVATSLMDLGRVERVEPVMIPVTDQPTAGLPGVRFELTV